MGLQVTPHSHSSLYVPVLCQFRNEGFYLSYCDYIFSVSSTLMPHQL